MLKNLIVSKVRIKILQVFFDQPGQIYYVRELVRMTGEEINAVRRELLNLEKTGLLRKEPRGNRLYYDLNKQHVLYGDLLSMIHKTVGIGKELVKKKAKLGKINLAMLSGRFVRRLETLKGGVDLLIIGEADLTKLGQLVQEEEKRLKREINYTAMTKNEFNFRKKRRDPFLSGILLGSRVMIIGDEEDLVAKYAEES
ncbi:MAG: hypothetical protein ABIH88_03185 [Patescibacteria group bacterium]|nr:hypothetical protein [Patescibacteria group bacterium]